MRRGYWIIEGDANGYKKGGQDVQGSLQELPSSGLGL